MSGDRFTGHDTIVDDEREEARSAAAEPADEAPERCTNERNHPYLPGRECPACLCGGTD